MSSAPKEVVKQVDDLIRRGKGLDGAQKFEEFVRANNLEESIKTNCFKGYSPINKAVMCNAAPIVRSLVQTFNVDVRSNDEFGRSALHYAAAYQHPEILVYLLMVDCARTCHDPVVSGYINSRLGSRCTSPPRGLSMPLTNLLQNPSVVPEGEEEDTITDQNSITTLQEQSSGDFQNFIASEETVIINSPEQITPGESPRATDVMLGNNFETESKTSEELHPQTQARSRGEKKGFIRWFEKHFLVKKGNAWESYLLKCIEHGFDSLKFWFDVLTLNERQRTQNERIQEKFQMNSILTNMIQMENSRHIAMFMKQIENEYNTNGILKWLAVDVELVRYVDAFLENGFSDVEDLTASEELSDEFLEAMGIENLPHRFKLLMHVLIAQGPTPMTRSDSVYETIQQEEDIPLYRGRYSHRSLGTVY